MTMRPHFVRILVLALCLGLGSVPAWTGAAEAQDWGRLMTPTRPLNVRDGRSRTAKKVTTLKPGQVVRVDFLKDEWVAVFDPDETERDEAKAMGYSKASYLKPAPSADWGEMRVVEPKMLNVRSGRGPGYDHVRTLYAGDTVKVDFLRDGWVAVFEKDATERKESKAFGYANERYLLKAGPDGKDEPKAGKPVQKAGKPEPVATDWGRLVRLTTNVKIRQFPKPDGELLATMVRDDMLKVHGRSGDWLRVYMAQERSPSPNAALGWAHRSGLDLTDGEFEAQPLIDVPDLDEETVETAEPAPEVAAEPESATAAETFAAASREEEPREYVLVVPEEVPSQAAAGPEPVADQQAHGFRYSILSNSGRDGLSKSMEIRVYVDVNVVPDSEDLRDFAHTIWKKEGDPGKQGAVLIYLPGQDRNSLSYGQGRFSPRGPGEFWTRETTLYGTRFK